MEAIARFFKEVPAFLYYLQPVDPQRFRTVRCACGAWKGEEHEEDCPRRKQETGA